MASSLLSSSSSSTLASPSLSPSPLPIRSRRAGSVVVSCCHSSAGEPQKCVASRREMVVQSVSMISGLFAWPALALLETDDDEFLLEKVKEDRLKRIGKRGEFNSLKKEAESVQIAVYELSKAGQAIDGEDFTLANSVLGTSDIAWIKDVKDAFSKVNKNAEEEDEATNFSEALMSLQAAVLNKDFELSKLAFVASANALERWSSLTGFSDQIKGL